MSVLIPCRIFVFYTFSMERKYIRIQSKHVVDRFGVALFETYTVKLRTTFSFGVRPSKTETQRKKDANLQSQAI